MHKRRTFILGTVSLLGVLAAVIFLTTTPSRFRPRLTSGDGQSQFIATPKKTIKPGPYEGALAPSFSAPRFSGGTLGLVDLRGKGVVMNFFASWCTPCREEAHNLEVTYQKYRARGIVFLGVDIEEDDLDDARDFLNKLGVTYTAIRDVNGEIAQKYQLVGLPTTYFIDKDGIIRSKFAGGFLGPEGLKELERRMQMILPK